MYIRDTGESYNDDSRQNRIFNKLNEENIEEFNEEETLEENYNDTTEGIVDQDALLEAYFIDEISRMNDEQRQAFFNSDGFQALYEAGTLGYRSVVKLNKAADLSRRISMAAIQKAKETGDGLWNQLKKIRIAERKALDRIIQKYGNSVKQDAKKASARFIKLHKATNLGQTFSNLTGIR